MTNRLALLMSVLCACMLMSSSGLAQRAALQVRVPAYGIARTPVVDVGPAETLAIRASRPGELMPAIFIYDETRALVAKNDETRGGGVFEWQPPRSMKLQIVIYSNSDQALDYSIDVLPPELVRAGAEAEPSHAVVRVLFATDRRV